MKNIFRIILLMSVISYNSLFCQTESYTIYQLFSSSSEITKLSSDLISIAVDAVWGASEATGVPTITGTLTQSQSNLDYWSYSPSPSDMLKLISANGSTIDFKFISIDGYSDGDAEDFKNSHDMDFTIYTVGEIDLHIVSSTGPENGVLHWQRNIQGNVLYEDEIMHVDFINNGRYEAEISFGFGIYHYWEEVLGDSYSNTVTSSISEGYWKTITHNSNEAIFALNTEIRNNSSATINNITYRYENAHVFWAAYTQFADSANAGIYNKVIDSHQWIAEGSLLKNDQLYGNVQFDSSPVNGTYGPILICKLFDETDIYLHSLLNPFVTDVELDDFITDNYSLEQNYPNPFNPTTTINYSIPQRSSVILTLFDVLGRKVSTIVNKEQPQGNYEVEFDGKDFTSGIYFYRLQSGDFVETKKMILMK